GKGACHGDVGSPMLVNGYLIGIMSWGASCATPGRPVVYSKISANYDWIQANFAAVQPIALQPPGAEVRPGTRAHVCGWGDIYEGSGTTPDILRVADVIVLSDFECTRIY
ncbi:kappaTry, partial [Carabus blaptoides fortunei]